MKGHTLVINAVDVAAALDEESTLRRQAADPLRAMAEEVQEGIVCEVCWQVHPPSDPDTCSVCGSQRPDAGWAKMPYDLNSKYQCVRLLGRGAMGAVFMAVDMDAPKDSAGRAPVRAVKVIQGTAGTEEFANLTRMFEHEAAASALLGRSPYFVKIFGYELGSNPYLVMQLVNWPSLKGLLSAGPLSSMRTAELGIALLQAVEVMHFYRVVHRDLKPSNIFIHEHNGAYRIKIADLGIWTRDHDAALPESLRSHSTMVHGTTGYMSPEQMQSSGVGCRSDLHAIGSILWVACTGNLPFPVEGETLVDQIRDRIEKVKHVPSAPSVMSEELYDVLKRALAHDTDERFQTAREMTEALRESLAIANKKKRWLEGARRELEAVSETFRELEQDPRMIPAITKRLGNLKSGIHTMHEYLSEGGTLDAKVFNSLMSSLRRDLSEIKEALADPYHQQMGIDEDADDDPPTVEMLREAIASTGRDMSDRYDVGDLVGAGGIAKVYEATHRQLGRRVAIKQMNQTVIEGLTEEQQRQLFEAEARSSSVLEHPNTVFVLDYDVDSHGLPYLVMEYIGGESLAHRLENQTLSEQEALEVFEPIASALAEAHACGIVHRNIKPKRIVFKTIPALGDIPKIYGFGPHKDDAGRVLPKGMLFGTPKYMAPEQLRNQDIDPAADVYALGTLLFEALTGDIPHRGPNLRASLAAKIKEDPPLLPREIAAGAVSAELQAICAAMLQRNPRSRPPATLICAWFHALRNGRAAEVPLQRLRSTSLVSA